MVESDNGFSEPLVPINLQLDLSPSRLEIDMTINEMVLTNEVRFVMQWQDKRMAKSPCKVHTHTYGYLAGDRYHTYIYVCRLVSCTGPREQPRLTITSCCSPQPRAPVQP